MEKRPPAFANLVLGTFVMQDTVGLAHDMPDILKLNEGL